MDAADLLFGYIITIATAVAGLAVGAWVAGPTGGAAGAVLGPGIALVCCWIEERVWSRR